MKIRLLIALLTICPLAFTQVFSTVESLVNTLQSSMVDDSAQESTIRDLELQLAQQKQLEQSLRDSLEFSILHQAYTDSIKRVEWIAQIDQQRQANKGYPVVVDDDTLFVLYAARGGQKPSDRAHHISDVIRQIGAKLVQGSDSMYVQYGDYADDIVCGDRFIMTVTELDAIWMSTSRQELTQLYHQKLETALIQLREQNNLFQRFKQFSLFVLVLVVLYLLFRLLNYLFRRAKARIELMQQTRLKGVKLKDYEFLTAERQAYILVFIAGIIRYILMLILILISIPILFSIFPQTEYIAIKILTYIWIPVKKIGSSIVAYIPNLFTIGVICLVMRYVIRGLQFMALEIEQEKLKISGFYSDWAQPTFNIFRFLLYAFTIAVIYPYLPGSDSGVFQGISIFVGLIVSLGSSTVIANIIAGLVITYMRPFKLGDRIKLNDTLGNVIEKTAFVTRIRTPKNEVITIPNSFIMSSHTTNYSSSARMFGLILHSSVTIGYDAPWRQVHELLIEAALATEGVQSEPMPFVLETELGDFYPTYQVNVYIKDADLTARIYSELHQNIQDKFNQAGVEILSPHYRAERDGNEITIPKGYRGDNK